MSPSKTQEAIIMSLIWKHNWRQTSALFNSTLQWVNTVTAFKGAVCLLLGNEGFNFRFIPAWNWNTNWNINSDKFSVENRGFNAKWIIHQGTHCTRWAYFTLKYKNNQVTTVYTTWYNNSHGLVSAWTTEKT